MPPSASRRMQLMMIAVAVVAATAIVPFYQGVTRHFLDASDADIIYVYEALRANSGMPQHYFDHPGYVYFLILAGWFQLLNLLGFVSTIHFAPMAALSGDVFVSAYAKLVYGGRVLAILLSALYALAVFFGVRWWTRNIYVAALCGFVFALCTGTAMQSLIMRNELPSSLFVFVSFLALLGAVRAPLGRNELFLGLVGFFAVLAMLTKVQSIFLLLGLPVLAIAFGCAPTPYAGPTGCRELKLRSLALWLSAVAIGLPATLMVVWAIRQRDASGLYQVLLVIYVAATMIAYGRLYGVAWRRVLDAMAALVIGISLGFFVHLIHHNPNNLRIIVDFVGHMVQFSQVRKGLAVGGATLPNLLPVAWHGIQQVVAARTVDLNLIRQPFPMVEFGVLIGALVVAWRGRYQVACQALLLLGLALTVEAVFHLRYFAPWYQIYTQPWVIFAAGLLVAAALDLKGKHLRAVLMSSGAVALIVIALSLNQTLSSSFPPRQAHKNACYQAKNYMPGFAAHFARYCRQ